MQHYLSKDLMWQVNFKKLHVELNGVNLDPVLLCSQLKIERKSMRNPIRCHLF